MNSKFKNVKNVVLDVLNLLTIYLLTEGLTLVDRRCRLWLHEGLSVEILCWVFFIAIIVLMVCYIKRTSSDRKNGFRQLVEKMILLFFVIDTAYEKSFNYGVFVRVKTENFSEMLGFLVDSLFAAMEYDIAINFFLLSPPFFYLAYFVYKNMKEDLLDDSDYADSKRSDKKPRPVIINNFFIFKHYSVHHDERVIEIEDKRQDNDHYNN